MQSRCKPSEKVIMDSIFPIKSDVDPEIASHLKFYIEEDETSAIFQTLSNETARKIYTQLCENPHTASNLASSLDKPLANVCYHLTSLLEAGLIRIIDTWYSSRGVDMKVYAPVAECLVLVAESGKVEHG